MYYFTNIYSREMLNEFSTTENISFKKKDYVDDILLSN